MVKKRPSKKLLTAKKIVATLAVNKSELRSYGVKRIGLFGSYLKGTAGRKSDIDFLVSFNKVSFDNYMDLKFFLEKIFGRKVDLVMVKALKPGMAYVKKEALYVAGA